MKADGDLTSDLEGEVDKGDFLEFDKEGNPKKASLAARVLARFQQASTGDAHDHRRHVLPPRSDR